MVIDATAYGARSDEPRGAPSAAVYLDHAATTPIDPQVVAAMVAALTDTFGNPSSQHRFGWAARDLVEESRARVARLIGAEPGEIIFTSGATESNALAILGLGRTQDGARGGHVVAGAAEHKSVLAPVEHLRSEQLDTTLVPPGRDGRTDVDDVLAAIRPDTRLVSLMWVNNETGVVNPIPELAAALRASCPGVLLHTDATQAVGKLAVDVSAGLIDVLSLSAHKLYGPKGVGALYVSSSVRPRLVALVPGGGQEGGTRGGTSNVAGIVGLGTAASLAGEQIGDDRERAGRLGDLLVAELRRVIPALAVLGDGVERVPGIRDLVLPGVSAEALLTRLGDSVAVSAGSACSGGSTDVSHVLHAMGVSDEDARSTIRFSLGRTTTEHDVVVASAAVLDAVTEVGASPPAAVERRSVAVPSEPGIEPIGVVSSPVEVPAYIEWRDVVSRIVLDSRLAPAIDGLEEYSHVVVVAWLHEITTSKLRHVPPGAGGGGTRGRHVRLPVCLPSQPDLDVDGPADRGRGRRARRAGPRPRERHARARREAVHPPA